MAGNLIKKDGRYQSRAVSAGVVSGDPVVFGSYLHGVALTDRNTAGYSSIDFGPAIYDIPVKGHDGSSNAGVSLYQAVYYDSVLGGLNVNTAGVFYGYALETVVSGSTTTINVFVCNIELPLGIVTNALIADDAIRQTKHDRDFTLEEFESNPVHCLGSNAGGAAAGTTGAVNVMMFEENSFEYVILGAGQTIIVPQVAADGLLISLDLTNNEGIEITQGITARSRSAFVIGTSPAFYFKATLKIADVSGTDDCLVGFRKAMAYGAAVDDYDDMAALNVISGNINIETILNDQSTTTTDTTDDWADTEEHTLEVYVSAAGVVTYMIDGVAPTVTAAFTFDTGDTVIPFIYLLHDATTPGAVHLQSWECGLQ